MIRTSALVRFGAVATAIVALAVIPAGAAGAVTSIDGPIDLGTAAPFAVLAASTVTNTGPSDLTGDVGLSPGTSITGFPPGNVDGTIHPTDDVAAQAQVDLETAYGVAASLTPVQTGLVDLTGLSLTPGVYSGGELAVTGALTLDGEAESVWVFQAASTLTIASGAIITVTGGASACNVFWQVGSSATIQTAAQMVGTVMASESVTAQTAATVTGRLLALNAAVTLDTNTITAPTGCDETPGTVTSSPEATSTAPPEARVGDDYSHTITATGSPTPSFTITSGALPPGMELDSANGVLAGRPTTAGLYEFSIAVGNGVSPDATVTYALVVGSAVAAAGPDAAPGESAAPGLAASGTDVGVTPFIAAALLIMGTFLVHRTRQRGHSLASAEGLSPAKRSTLVDAPTTRRRTRG